MDQRILEFKQEMDVNVGFEMSIRYLCGSATPSLSSTAKLSKRGRVDLDFFFFSLFFGGGERQEEEERFGNWDESKQREVRLVK